MISPDQWNNIPLMPTIRRYPGVAALDNKIYVTGGYDGHEDLSSVDCYDPQNNTWSQVTNMKIARFGHCLLNLHGLLYALGGYYNDGDDDQYINICEVYDPDNGTILHYELDFEMIGSAACLIKKYMIM